MDLDDAAAVAAFDMATVVTSIGSRLPRWRQRNLWVTVARSALTGTAVALALPGPDVLSDAELYLWSEHPTEHARWERPPFQVRRSVVQAVSVPWDASAHLSAALDQAADLPEESGPLGRDAATVVVACAALGLGESLRSQRRALAGKLARRSEQSDDPNVAELGLFVAERLRGAATRVDEAADLPWLMRPEAIVLSPRSRGMARVAAELHLADVIEQAHLGPVLPMLTSATYRAVAPGLTFNAPGLESELTGPEGLLSLVGQIAEESQAGTTPAAVPEAPQSQDEFNVGLVRADRPDRPIVRGQVRAGTDHLIWASIGPLDPEAIPGDHPPIDLTAVPAADLLTIMVFPDQALSVPGTPYFGSVVMGTDRPLRVARPAELPQVSAGRLDSRLYFRVRTPDQPGNYDVRVLVYHQNVLLQARKLTLPVGQAGAHLTIRTPYTLVRSPTAASARELSPRRLCLYVNQSDTGSHQLCFSSLDDDNKPVPGWLDLEPNEVAGLFGPIRRGLWKVSWDSDEPDPGKREYRYRKCDGGRFAPDFAQLERDLCALAQSGYAVWYALTGRLIGDDPGDRDPLAAEPDRLRDDWRRRMASPGIIQLAPAHASNLVPPLAGIYDLDIDDQLPLAALRLCPEAAEVLRDGGDVAALDCFAAGCSHAGASTVCPSGFWGLRHEIAVSPTLDRSAGTSFRLRAGPRTALVGTLPENLLAGVTDHAVKVRGRFGPDNSAHVCSREEWFKAASQPECRFGVLYFLCHGGESRTTGGLVIFLDPPGESGRSGISEANLKVHDVLLDHHPMVMLNACQTAALEPDKVINLVEGFMSRGASAVIGTEIMIFPSLAFEFGERFMAAFVTGQASLGTAIRQARLSLLKEWNPLGLAYVGYGMHELSLTPAEAAPAAL